MLTMPLLKCSMNTAPLPPAYPGTQVFHPSLKRSRSRKFDPFRLPSLPRINGDVALQVFTHISLRRPGASPDSYCDNELVATVGRRAFELAITEILFHERPMLRGIEISEIREELLSSPMVADWVTAYKLTSKLRCHPDLHKSLSLPQEMANLFHAYLGGVYLTFKQHGVNEWIRRLLEPELEFVLTRSPPSKRVKDEEITPIATNVVTPFKSQLSSRIIKPMPQHQAIPALPNPLAPAQPELPFLPLFNQAAMQRRVTVEYVAEFSGPSHAGRWSVKCIVNGICKGEGTGSSKQVAKEEAARKAYYSMGWT